MSRPIKNLPLGSHPYNRPRKLAALMGILAIAVCLAYKTQHDRTISYLTRQLEQLLDYSHELYARVARVDTMIRDVYFSGYDDTAYSPLPN